MYDGKMEPLTFMGKKIVDMTREELIEAIMFQVQIQKSLYKIIEDYNARI